LTGTNPSAAKTEVINCVFEMVFIVTENAQNIFLRRQVLKAARKRRQQNAPVAHTKEAFPPTIFYRSPTSARRGTDFGKPYFFIAVAEFRPSAAGYSRAGIGRVGANLFLKRLMNGWMLTISKKPLPPKR